MSKKAIWTIVVIAIVVFLGFWFTSVSFVMRSLVKGPVSIKRGSVLIASLSGSFPEEPPGPMGNLFGIKKRLTVREITHLLRAAKDDERIEAILIKSGAVEELGWAKAKELHGAFLDFKESGKPIFGFMEAGSDKQYYVLSCADSIMMPELGMLMVDGLMAKVGFMKDTYGKVGIKWEGVRRGKYKAATEPYTRESMSDPFREQIEDLLDDVYGDYLQALAAARGKTPEEISLVVDDGPYLSAVSALKAGLIDRIAFLQEIEDEMGLCSSYGKGRGKGKGVKWQDYATSLRPGVSLGAKKIAIVHAVGAITSGKSKDSPWSGKTMGSTTISDAIKKAADNDQVKAIVMRVDSPGGSALASDIIWNAIMEAKKKKPFVVSMGDVAGSGGYYISCGADAIVAQPNTITGSIGVLALIPDMQELFKKIGYNLETVQRGEHADFLSTERPMADWERKMLDDFVQVVYDRFVNLVAQGRGKTYEDINEIGQGRVWGGLSAKENGLVDEIGGLETAVRIAKEKADIPETERVRFIYYPKKKTIADILKEGEFLDRIAWYMWERVPEELRDALETSRLSSLYKDEPVLLLAPEQIDIY